MHGQTIEKNEEAELGSLCWPMFMEDKKQKKNVIAIIK